MRSISTARLARCHCLVLIVSGAGLAAGGFSAGCSSAGDAASEHVDATSADLVSATGSPPVGPLPQMLPISPANIAAGTISQVSFGMVPAVGEPGYVPQPQASQYNDLAAAPSLAVGATPNYPFAGLPPSSDAISTAVNAWPQAFENVDGTAVTTVGAASAAAQAATEALSLVPTPTGYVVGSLANGPGNWTASVPSWASTLLAISGTPTGPVMASYPTARARWVASDQEPVGDAGTIDQLVSYAPPNAFADFRDRGARMYCAARTAVQNQNGKESALGSHRAAHISIFKQTIDLLDIDSTVSVMTPQKIDGGSGAQAFAVPLALGSKLSLIKINNDGFGLGEVRTPVVFVTADGEMLQQANYGGVPTTPYRINCFMGACTTVPTIEEEYRDTYQTTSTGEAVLVQGETQLQMVKQFTIAQIGPFFVSGGITTQYNHAQTAWGSDAVLEAAPGGLKARNGWSGVNSSGVGYHDGAWSFFSNRAATQFGWELYEVGALDTTWGEIPGLTGPSHTYSPIDMRADGDDDKSLSVEESASIGFTLGGGIGATIDGFTFQVGASGTVSAQIAAYDMIRDGLYATRASASATPAPAEGITIRPRDVTSLTAGDLAIFITIKTPKLPLVGSLSWTENLWQSGTVTLASSDSDSAGNRPFAESSYLRLGTGGPQTGDASSNSMGSVEQPSVTSHLPAGISDPSYTSSATEFASFPQTVDKCLADTTPLPTPAAGTPPSSSTYTAPPPVTANLCLSQTASTLQNGGISNLCTGYPANSCEHAWMAFLCSLPYTQTQVASNVSVVSQFDPSNATEVAAMTQALTTCANDYTAAGQASQFTPGVVESLVNIQACDASGNLLPSTGTVATH